MQTQQLEKLKSILGILDNSLTKEDFIAYFKQVLDLVKEIKKRNEEEIKRLNNLYSEAINKLNNAINEKISNIKVRDGINGRDGLDGEDGQNADENKIIEAVLKQIKIPTTQEIIDSMPKDELNFDTVKGLKRFYKEFKKQRFGMRFGGGGFSKSAMDLHFIDDETPTGDIDGVNTDFVLNYTPSPAASLKVFLDGQKMKLNTDYTFSNKTITFLTAPLTNSIILCDYRK